MAAASGARVPLAMRYQGYSMQVESGGRGPCLKKVTGMQPKMMARQTRALSWVLPGGHTQKMDRRMSASVSCNAMS